ncbi:MAG: deoxyribonuclease IV [Clostridiales bacterium]|jgi:deoxyribonuclease-4|nr:deoxyribonuclease IV [Clostridiales bacterium]
MKKMKIGSHVSMTGGLLGAAKEAASYGANTFMIYTGAPTNTIRKPVEKLKIEEGRAFMAEQGMDEIVVHAPYIINLASHKPETFELAVSFLKKEIERTAAIGAPYIVLHPGSYTDKDLPYGIDRIAEGLNLALTAEQTPLVCLETMAGKGSEVGKRFEELAAIIEKTALKHKLRVCFDTCHVHDAGYDIVNDLDGVMKNFDAALGLDRLAVFHINGSLNPLGGKKDRHANIGADAENPKGADHIGAAAIYKIVHSDYAKGRLLILETPWLDAARNLYKEEIAFLTGNGERL